MYIVLYIPTMGNHNALILHRVEFIQDISQNTALTYGNT
jgi:hypothetical protein